MEPKPQKPPGLRDQGWSQGTDSCRAKGLTADSAVPRGLLQNQTAREHHPQTLLQPTPAELSPDTLLQHSCLVLLPKPSPWPGNAGCTWVKQECAKGGVSHCNQHSPGAGLPPWQLCDGSSCTATSTVHHTAERLAQKYRNTNLGLVVQKGLVYIQQLF